MSYFQNSVYKYKLGKTRNSGIRKNFAGTMSSKKKSMHPIIVDNNVVKNNVTRKAFFHI